MTSASKKYCPICKNARTEEFHPFCSRGCRDRDLNQWFNDGYAVPARPAYPDEIAKADWDKQE